MGRFSYQSESREERHHYWLMYAVAAAAFAMYARNYAMQDNYRSA